MKYKQTMITILLCILFTTGCAKQIEPFEVTILLPSGTPALSMVQMVVDEPEIEEYVTITYETTAATDVLSAKLISKEVDMAVIPTNLALNLYNKGVPITLAGPAVWGVFYLVSTEEISSWTDLVGMEVATMGRGLTPDAMIRYLAINNGINPDEDINFVYYAGSTELAAAFIAGESKYAIVPEPLLTSVLLKREDAKVVMDFQEEWELLTGLSNYPQASLVIQNDLLLNHPEFLADFLEIYDQGIDWVNDNPEDAGNYYESLEIGLNQGIIAKAIPRSNMDFIHAQDAKTELEAYLQVLYDFNPDLIGGKMPDEGFYLK